MITFSGIDCSGKSTQIEIIKKEFEEQGIPCRVIWSRGGYTSWVEGIKTFIRRDKNFSEEEKKEYREQINKSTFKTRLLLWASICDLIRYYGIVFRWIELKGELILCDRYIWDTYIDFLMKYPNIKFENWLCWKLMIKLIKNPECSIIFTIPINVSMQRSIEKNDQHSEPYDFRKKRLEKYFREIKNKRWQYVIDAEAPIEEVTKKVKEIISENVKGLRI